MVLIKRISLKLLGFENRETAIKVIGNINLQRCKSFGLSVTVGEIHSNH